MEDLRKYLPDCFQYGFNFDPRQVSSHNGSPARARRPNRWIHRPEDRYHGRAHRGRQVSNAGVVANETTGCT